MLLSVEHEGKFYNNKNHKFQIQLQILDWVPGLMVSTPQLGFVQCKKRRVVGRVVVVGRLAEQIAFF